MTFVKDKNGSKHVALFPVDQSKDILKNTKKYGRKLNFLLS